MIAIATALLVQFVPSESAKPLIVLTYNDDTTREREPEVRFVLYDDRTVVFDPVGSGHAIDLRSKRLSPSEFADVRATLKPDADFADLKPGYHVGNIPDAPVYHIIAKLERGYKSVGIGGLLEPGMASPFGHEPSVARGAAPPAFIYLLDAILRLRFDGASPVEMRTFVVELYDISLVHREPEKECQWPSDWPTLEHATKIGGAHAVVDGYRLQLEGALWPVFRGLNSSCKRMVIGQRVFHVRAYSRLPGSALWLDPQRP